MSLASDIVGGFSGLMVEGFGGWWWKVVWMERIIGRGWRMDEVKFLVVS
jgi:hypothetical protein